MSDKSTLDFSKKDLHHYILLLSAPVLLTIYRYHAYPGTFTLPFEIGWADDESIRFFQFLIFFVLMFVIPVLYVKLIMKKSLLDFGLGFGNIKSGVKYLLLIPFVIVPAIYFAAQMPDVQSEYPLAKNLLIDQTNLIPYEIAYIVLYYIAWEFYFRGFLLFGLKDRYGAIAAILIQTVSSCLVHIDKPEGEIMGSIFVGIIFGYIALRTKSIWYVFLLHATIGVLTDLFIIYTR